jgi:hypothetical protein
MYLSLLHAIAWRITLPGPGPQLNPQDVGMK